MTASRRELMMPSLLDRLVEHASPDQSADPQRNDWFVSPQQYLESVRRDLVCLLKTEVNLPTTVRVLDETASKSSETSEAKCLADYPSACSSAITFGIPTSSGGQGLQKAGYELARAVECAIRAFEPRIDPRTLRVRLAPQTDEASEHNTVSSFGFEIEGDIRMKPLPEHLLLKAFYLPAVSQWRLEGAGYGS